MAKQLPHLCLLVFLAAASIGVVSGGAWAGLGIAFSLIMFFCVWFLERQPPWPETGILLFACTALVISAALNFNSTQPQLSWKMWQQLVTVFLPLSLLTAPTIQKHAYSQRLFEWLPLTVMLSALLLSIDLIEQGPFLKLIRGPEAPLYRYDRGFSYLVTLAFPTLAMLWATKKRWLIIPFIIIFFIAASTTESRAAKLALILALLTVPITALWPAIAPRLLMAVPFFAAAWPFVVQRIFLAHHDWIEKLPPSWQDRMEIWDYMSYRILDKPLLGWGLGSSPKVPFAEPNGALYHYELAGAPHPHNAAIQLWVELGLPGLLLGIGFAIWSLYKINQLDRRLKPFAIGAWIASLCFSMVSYNFWSDSLWAAFALVGLAFALLQTNSAKPVP